MNEQERNWLYSPILIGIAGHTQIHPASVPVLADKVREILSRLKKKYPCTPIVIVSSLAEGADQICADVAISLEMDVIAPLPFPPDQYETRFKAEEAKQKLRQLTGPKSPRVRSFCPPGTTGGSIDFEGIINDKDRRKQRYADMAVFVARHSHAMLVLWDGNEDDKSSLTVEILKYKTQGYLPPNVHPITAASEIGIVYQLFTPRPDWTPARGGTPGELKILPATQTSAAPDKSTAAERGESGHSTMALFERTCSLTNSLNELLAAEAGSNQSLPENTLLKDNSKCSALQNQLAVFRKLVAKFSARDKSRVIRAYGLVFFLVFLGAALLHAYGHWYHETAGRLEYEPWLLFAGLAGFLCAASYPLLFGTRDTENRSLDYRALAEALRVQFYWNYAGLFAWAPDHYLQRQRSELDWIRQATRAWELRLQAENSCPVPIHDRLQEVVKDWFGEQAAFYEKEHKRSEKQHKFWRGISSVCGLIGLLEAVLLLCFSRAAEPPHKPFPYLLAFGLTILISAMTLAYGEKRLFAEHARHFGAMRDVFCGAMNQCEQLIKSGRDGEVADVVLQMGKEALDENTDWLILHRVRHFELPPVG